MREWLSLADTDVIKSGTVIYAHGPYENGDIYLAKAWCRRNRLSPDDYKIKLEYCEENKEKIESVLVIKK